MPFILDHGAVAELVGAVAPKPVNVVIHDYDESVGALAALGVRRRSAGASLASAAWNGFATAAEALRGCAP